MTASPTPREMLLSLRDRLAKATGPNRELDADIFQFIVGGKMWDRWYWNSKAMMPRGYVEDALVVRTRGKAPAYTASIDAAVTLVPDGFGIILGWSENKMHCSVRMERSQPTNAGVVVEGKTLAITICLARVAYEIGRTHD